MNSWSPNSHSSPLHPYSHNNRNYKKDTGWARGLEDRVGGNEKAYSATIDEMRTSSRIDLILHIRAIGRHKLLILPSRPWWKEGKELSQFSALAKIQFFPRVVEEGDIPKNLSVWPNPNRKEAWNMGIVAETARPRKKPIRHILNLRSLNQGFCCQIEISNL